jgi:hypothetical protein
MPVKVVFLGKTMSGTLPPKDYLWGSWQCSWERSIADIILVLSTPGMIKPGVKYCRFHARGSCLCFQGRSFWR